MRACILINNILICKQKYNYLQKKLLLKKVHKLIKKSGKNFLLRKIVKRESQNKKLVFIFEILKFLGKNLENPRAFWKILAVSEKSYGFFWKILEFFYLGSTVQYQYWTEYS